MNGKFFSKASLSTASDRTEWLASADDIYINQIDPNIMRDSGFDDANEWNIYGNASITDSKLVAANTTGTIVNQTGHTLTAGDTYQLSINCKSLSAGGYALAIDTPTSTGNVANMGTLLGINPVEIIVPDGGDRFRVSTYAGTTASFDDFRAEKVESGVPPVSGVIPNSIDTIWNDMTGANDSYPSAMPAGWPQFGGPVFRSTAWIYANRDKKSPAHGTWERLNVWVEIFNIGSYPPSGVSCGDSINTATNTRVEMGTIMAYYRKKGETNWRLIANQARQASGVISGKGGGLYGTQTCALEPFNYDYWDPKEEPNPQSYERKLEDTGFDSVKPLGNWRWHGWSSQTNVEPIADYECTFGQLYVRLVVDNPALPDDRDDAKFVVHLGSDMKDAAIYTISGTGTSRWMTVTKDWKPINFLAGDITYADLVAYPPPFSSTP